MYIVIIDLFLSLLKMTGLQKVVLVVLAVTGTALLVGIIVAAVIIHHKAAPAQQGILVVIIKENNVQIYKICILIQKHLPLLMKILPSQEIHHPLTLNNIVKDCVLGSSRAVAENRKREFRPTCRSISKA